MSNYKQNTVVTGQSRFTKAPMSALEFSTMVSAPTHITTFNAGDIVPIYCGEVLPHDTISIDVFDVIRQATVLTPTMGELICDIYAYEVPNRVVNSSWVNVQGENDSGAWVAPEVSLVSLLNPDKYYANNITIPVGSVADYYGYPTQQAIPPDILKQCHDLKFRGYIEIYNTYFRDQNYQPPIPYSKLNIYNGFMEGVDYTDGYPTAKYPVSIDGSDFNNGPGQNYTVPAGTKADGSFPDGAIVKGLYGAGGQNSADLSISPMVSTFSALGKPLKANKLHDYFTSVLPSPQKGNQVVFGIGDSIPVSTGPYLYDMGYGLKVSGKEDAFLTNANALRNVVLANENADTASSTLHMGLLEYDNSGGSVAEAFANNKYAPIKNSNMYVDLSSGTGVALEDFRLSAAYQQVFELLGRGGTRYQEYINSFFGLDIDNPFDSIPTQLGHIRHKLNLFQTAQTSASTENSAQGNLAAFGYTTNGGKLFHHTFKEHGYVHIFAVVRHKNLYPSLLSRDNFRLNMFDFYLPQLANLSEQPVYTREINPFSNDIDGVFGYQEAWAEYRMEPDRVSGYMRPGIETSLDIWNYADPFDSGLKIAEENWLKSNTEDIVRRTTAVTDAALPQFKGQFMFKITKERPMPTYSVSGLDII